MTFDYDTYAKRYDTEKDFDRYLLEFKCRELLAHKESLGDTLELGCANGNMTERIFPHLTSIDVVDSSADYTTYTEEKIKRAYGEESSKARYHTMFFDDFEPGKQYDTILLVGVLPALDDQVSFLKRIGAWLKDGGVIYITSHNGNSLHRRLGKIMGLVKDETELSHRDKQLFNHHKVYTHATLRNDVEQSGLSVKKQTGIFLKQFPNDRMLELSEEMVEALYTVSPQIDPELLAEIILFAGKK